MGREIEGLDQIDFELSQMPEGWYDGELIGEDFNSTQSQTLKKGQKSNLVFNIFDYLTFLEVINQKGIYDYSQRRERLDEIFGWNYIQSHFQYVNLVPVIFKGTYDYDKITELLDRMTEQGSEGIMINTNEPYEFKRTENLIKVKKMYTLDLRVMHIQEGAGQNQGKLGNVIVDYKGYAVGVGSGFSKTQREYYWEHPEEIIGKIIEVQAFEECKNKEGSLSLRFPVFIRIRDDKEEVSYD